MDSKKLDALRRKYSDAKGGDMYDPEFRKVAAAQFQGDKRKWPFADPATLLGAPFRPQAASEGFAGLDAALVGVPMDLGVTNRAGARLGPRAVRAWSVSGRTIMFWLAPRAPRSPTSATCRSAAATAWRAATRTSRRSTRDRQAGVGPLSVGGDHSISYPILKAVGREARRHGAHRRALRYGRPL